MVVWTAALAVIFALTTVGSVPACPEASPVGLTEAELAEILSDCARRAPADWTPLALGVVAWLGGMLAIAVGAALWSRVRMADQTR